METEQDYGTGVRSTGEHRRSTETKEAFRTTEFWAYALITFTVLIAGIVHDDDGSAADGGGFGAEKVWLYVTLLTIGYLISRGLAKIGTKAPYEETSHHGAGAPLSERVKGAAQVLRDGQGRHGSASSDPATSEAETRPYNPTNP